MRCPFCHKKLSDEDLKYLKCPHCNPELSTKSRQQSDSWMTSWTNSESKDLDGDKTRKSEIKEYHHSKGSHEDIQLYPGFDLKGEIGRGGLGSVFLAREIAARRDVAIKTIIPFRKKELEKRIEDRFLEEAYITAQLQHPGIIPIYMIGKDIEGNFFYTMRPVEGESLQQIISKLKRKDTKTEKKFPLRRLIEITVSICRTMHFAHERGVVHRDLKPANIIVGDYGEVLVIDWGLAKVIVSQERPIEKKIDKGKNLFEKTWTKYEKKIFSKRHEEGSTFDATIEGQTLGSPGYMSPEHVLGIAEDIDFLSDIWSIGVILYECVTRRNPFKEKTNFNTMKNILHADPVHPNEVDPKYRVPPELSDIILKCLQKDKNERYTSVVHVAKELDQWLEAVPPWLLHTEFDFSTMTDGKPEGLTIVAGTWEIKNGLLCGPDFGGILINESIVADVRLEIEAKLLEERQGSINIQLSADEPDKSQIIFYGYLFRIMAGDKKMATLLKDNFNLRVENLPCSVNEWQLYTAERTGNFLHFLINDEEVLQYRDFFPLTGTRVGLISNGEGLRIKKLRVYVRGASEIISCLAVPKSYFDNGLLDHAYENYRFIMVNHRGREVAAEAAFQAGLCILEQVKSIDRKSDTDFYEEKLNEAIFLFDHVEQTCFAPLGVLGKALIAELKGNFDEEVDQLLRALKDYPGYDTLHVVSERLKARQYIFGDLAEPNNTLCRGIEKVLRNFLPDDSNQYPLMGLAISSLNLSAEIDKIDGLRGLSLKSLNLSQSRVSDLSALNGMKLASLCLPKTVSDISTLQEMKLEEFDLSLTSVKDISPLATMPLKTLILAKSVTDIEPLSKLPLKHLDLHKTSVKNVSYLNTLPIKFLRLPESLRTIEPLDELPVDFLQIPPRVSTLNSLKGLSLRGLDLRRSNISDLSPLSGMNLEYIDLSEKCIDISPLKGMPIRSLNLFNTNVTNLECLPDLPMLEQLSIYPEGLTDNWVDVLQKLDKLTIISTDQLFTPQKTAEFWENHKNGLYKCSRDELTTLAHDKQELKNSLGKRFRWIPPGVFVMGSPFTEEGHRVNEVQHFVCISKGFYIGIYPVTFAEFIQFVKETEYQTEAEKEGWSHGLREGKWGRVEDMNYSNPGFNQRENHPVVCVSWNDARAFCIWLSKKEGRVYRLPTESEWEYACRAGTETAYYGELEKVCWHSDNSDLGTHKVGKKERNGWGLFDMHGNVWEWCLDYYGEYPTGFEIDPKGSNESMVKVFRGGSWGDPPDFCRSAFRYLTSGTNRSSSRGFRVIITVS